MAKSYIFLAFSFVPLETGRKVESNSGKPLLATSVRLSFHDCVGGHDGCLNINNALEEEYQACHVQIFGGTVAWF